MINSDVHAIAPLGSTGEGAYLSDAEWDEVSAYSIKKVAKRVPTIVSVSDLTTAKAVRRARYAEAHGADAVMVLPASYWKLSEAEILAHYAAIGDSIGVPIMLYNNPPRTSVNVLPPTLVRCMQGAENIVGIKDATGGFDRACDLIARAPKEFGLYTGDDMTAVATIALGFHGDISVTANVAPRLMHEMCVAARHGDMVKAREIHFKLLGLHRDLFCEANPIPVKWAVHQLGLMPNGIRLPLTTLSEASQPRVLAALRQAGLIA